MCTYRHRHMYTYTHTYIQTLQENCMYKYTEMQLSGFRDDLVFLVKCQDCFSNIALTVKTLKMNKSQRNPAD